MSGLIPSLLDRLIDDEPDTIVDPADDEEDLIRRMKLGLRRDLEGLLNSRRPYSRWLGMGALEATIVGFGLPDLSTEDFASESARERIRRLIVQAIRTFEPRLRKVEVESDGGPTAAGVRFRINAVLVIDRDEEQVIYDARLRPADREFAVRLAR
jgi:type VI secretion system protein ImpF